MNENKELEERAVNVPYIVHESAMARQEQHVKRMFIALLVAISMLFVSNVAWLVAWMQYDYVSEIITVDSADNGNANYIGGNGDMNVDQNDMDAQTKDLDEKFSAQTKAALEEIHKHLAVQDEKIDRILEEMNGTDQKAV